MNGATGLDYTAVWLLIDKYQFEHPIETFEEVRAMELAALEQMAENRESKNDRHNSGRHRN